MGIPPSTKMLPPSLFHFQIPPQQPTDRPTDSFPLDPCILGERHIVRATYLTYSHLTCGAMENSRCRISMLLATTHASQLVALTHIIDLLKQLDAVPVIDARVAKLMSDISMSDKCAESSPASADLENSRLVGKQPSFFSEKEDDASTAATELVARLVAEQIVHGNANNNAATTSTNTNTNTPSRPPFPPCPRRPPRPG